MKLWFGLWIALQTILPAQEKLLPPVEEDYNQWKQALGTNSATSAERLTALPGFSVELLHSARPGEGSWVAVACDPRGRLVIAREDRGLLRLTLPTSHRFGVQASAGQGAQGRLKPGLLTNAAASIQIETINTNLLECRGLLFAHDALYANANNSKGLYRLRDTNNDDQFDEVKLLRATPGGVGHGRNQLALGPDGMIYSIHGDDVGLPTNGVAPSSPFGHYAEDHLLPCDWDKHLSNASAKMPFGHLIRTDRDGRVWELVAGGLRNPFGIDFNEAGDAFTYDADMEWDVGLSWYHPTRVLHLVSGGDYGWRRGTGVLPAWSPDTLPSAVDIGLGSPVAVKFGTKSNFPNRWRQALFILDWAYGKIFAVHLQRAGASYAGRAEVFLKGRPLNVTGLDFGPDGAMYFTTGGRRTQSGLYRVRWTGSEPERLVASPEKQGRGETRARGPSDPQALWRDLNDDDRWVRHAAAVTLEAQPPALWREPALAESRPMAGLSALLALARTDDASQQPAILRRLRELSGRALTADEQLVAVRAFGVCFLRMGQPDRAVAQEISAFWESHYPTVDARVNQALCELLVYLDSTNVVPRSLLLLTSAATQEEKMHYLFTLRLVKSGWTLEERHRYFDWLARARSEFQGANMLLTALNYIRADAEATLTPPERTALASTLAALDKPAAAPTAPTVARPFVQAWKMSDLSDALTGGSVRDPARGRRLFTEAGCAQCHRLGREGGVVGPDLTAVASRFDRRALLESILEPSKIVAEIYRNITLMTKEDAIFEGRIVSEDSTSVTLATNPVDPDRRQRFAKTNLASRRISEVSPMPAGSLNMLTKEEILDLLAWIESGGSEK